MTVNRIFLQQDFGGKFSLSLLISCLTPAYYYHHAKPMDCERHKKIACCYLDDCLSPISVCREDRNPGICPFGVSPCISRPQDSCFEIASIMVQSWKNSSDAIFLRTSFSIIPDIDQSENQRRMDTAFKSQKRGIQSLCYSGILP